MKITTNLIFLFFLSFFLSCTTNKQIDLIVYNAKVYTVDSVFSTVEAIAVNNGVIVEIGDSQDLLNKYDAKEKVDVNGKFIYPGFYDAHAHFFMLAEAMDEVDLVGSLSYNEVLERLKTYVAHNPDKKMDRREWLGSKPVGRQKFPYQGFIGQIFPRPPDLSNPDRLPCCCG
jgi:predicted amidohydrolase YtcJ